MKDRRERRMRAYRYIVEQANKVNQDLSCKSEKILADADYISLDDVVRLKGGLADPSRELVIALKKLSALLLVNLRLMTTWSDLSFSKHNSILMAGFLSLGANLVAHGIDRSVGGSMPPKTFRWLGWSK